jgi:WD40 repeat protein/tetratricopeptide (TPR) repeat protein
MSVDLETTSFVPSSQNRRGSLPSWLKARQEFGVSPFERTQKRFRVQPAKLSYVAAWNPSRMNNMMLAVGPSSFAASLCDDDDSSGSQAHDDFSENTEESVSDEEISEIDSAVHEDGSEDSPDDGSCQLLNNSEDNLQPNEVASEQYMQNQRTTTEQSGAATTWTAPASERFQSRRASIKHSGCINTACWMDCPWRFCESEKSIWYTKESGDCPTQLVTSGDDRCIMLWDLRDSMGSGLVIPWKSHTPFGYREDKATPERRLPSLSKHKKNLSAPLSGRVIPLVSFRTGHRGNVFHVTPVKFQPGKVLTCGADGYLRISDLTAELSSVVVHPHGEEDLASILGFGSAMAYSHQMVTENMGLICSERGLHRFDLRLSPREQQNQSLLRSLENGTTGSRDDSCKACALWTHGGRSGESNYVFTGGSSEFVSLYDLRMEGGNKSRILQRYKPKNLETNGRVSVSGLDVSKNGKELLVSYESDQIYTFPIFHNAISQAGPSINELDSCHKNFSSDPAEAISESASYGGHLNRFTFLKNAKYAGPSDEYICTGSDSGHAWVYERATGSVVSFLKADASTCNGVLPHPSLPFLVTYGIDSTAKLWRATLPVDDKMDDSPVGRKKKYKSTAYRPSPVTSKWNGVQALLNRFSDGDPQILLPDFIPSTNDMKTIFRLPLMGNAASRPVIENALSELPTTLRQNHYECYGALREGLETPVNHPLIDVAVSIILIRLRHQADRLGLPWNLSQPWVFEQRESIDAANLVPDNPSDWIYFDPNMMLDSFDPRSHFNIEEFPLLLAQRECFRKLGGEEVPCLVPWLDPSKQKTEQNEDPAWSIPDEKVPRSAFCLRSRKLLLETIKLLKTAGNGAMQEGKWDAAARWYDKAIQYCAVAMMKYPSLENYLTDLSGHVSLVTGADKRSRQVIAVWSPLTHLLVTIRLNMALLLTKQHSSSHPCPLMKGQSLLSLSIESAKAALEILLPFAQTPNEVRVSSCDADRFDYVLRTDEAPETYTTAKYLLSKAYFRLGTAQLGKGKYSDAVEALERCVTNSTSTLTPATMEKGGTVDALVLRRLREAKRKCRNRRKRCRARFERLSAQAVSGDDGDPPPVAR